MSNIVQLHCGGPAGLYVAVQGGSPYFLGHATDKPTILVKREYKPVYADPSSSSPHDLSYAGQVGFVNATLSRFQWSVLNLIEQYPHSGIGNAGTDYLGDIGALPGTEGRNLVLWVSAPYAALKPAMAGDPIGWRFLVAHPVGEPEKIETSTGQTLVNLSFLCLRTYDPLTGNQCLYDRNLTGLPAAR